MLTPAAMLGTYYHTLKLFITVLDTLGGLLVIKCRVELHKKVVDFLKCISLFSFYLKGSGFLEVLGMFSVHKSVLIVSKILNALQFEV